MVAPVLASVLTQSYEQMPGLEKMCSNFIYYPNKIIFLCAVMGVGKKTTTKKCHKVICSHVW
jgi:hypothetical protein